MIRVPRDLPITRSEADAALARLTRFGRLVLAVSGGPDSMALMLLAAEWRARRAKDAPEILVATVDHQLRPESAAEAAFVAGEAARLGFPHTILTWHGDKPGTGVADAARRARYRLLEEYALSLGSGATAIVAAHHRGDQAETFAMRLARGAGLDGLAAMLPERSVSEGSPIALVRPLLEFPKSRLLATLAERGLPFVDDPTNRNESFERPRLRRALPALESIGIDEQALARSARRLGDARAALRYAEDHFVSTLSLSLGNEVFAAFDRASFAAGPLLLRQKVLTRLIARFGGASPAPELSEIEDLAARLEAGDAAMRTLGGAMISPGRRFVRIWREAARLDEPDAFLAAGETRVWDRRFLLRLSAQAGQACSRVTIRPLDAGTYSRIAAGLVPGRRPPARAARALPAFWDGENLLAVPSLAPFAAAAAQRLDPAGFELRPLAPPASR